MKKNFIPYLLFFLVFSSPAFAHNPWIIDEYLMIILIGLLGLVAIFGIFIHSTESDVEIFHSIISGIFSFIFLGGIGYLLESSVICFISLFLFIPLEKQIYKFLTKKTN